MPLTEQELARLEALAAAATPGPWKQTSLFGGLIEQCEQPKRSVALVNHSDTGDYIVAACHAVPALVAEVRRLAYELETARTANTTYIADADLYRQAELARYEHKGAMEQVARLEAERDAALAQVAKMRPVVEAAVRWLSDLTEYAELELERAARDYRDKEAKNADKG